MKIEIFVKNLDDNKCKIRLEAKTTDDSKVEIYDVMEYLTMALINLSKDYEISEEDFFNVIKKIYDKNENNM